MRPLIVSEFMTLDGVMEAPGGETTHPHTGWVMDYQSEEQEAYKYREVMDAETLLLGRVTYESFAGAWPTYEGEFADRMNAIEKVVVSKTLRDPRWNNTTVLDGQAVADVTDLKQGVGGPILVAGSHSLVHLLLQNELVDELRLMIFPVTIGSGLRVFPDAQKKATWQLTDTVTFPSTVRLDTYVPA